MLDIVGVYSGEISVKSKDGSINDILKVLLALYTGFESISMNGI